MKKIFITGMSASGKSTLGEELLKRGYPVIDIDKVIGSCNWYNKKSGKIAEYYSGIGRQWLEDHAWNCDFEQINTRIESYQDEIVFVVGITTNQFSFLTRFDKIFVLRIDDETMLHRLKNRDTNDFAQKGSEQQWILNDRESFEEAMISHGAQALDATRPVPELAEMIIAELDPRT